MLSPSSVRTGVIGILAVTSLVVLILSTHINIFMGFFYAADRFPFVLSIMTIGTIVFSSIVQFVSRNTPLARPIVEVLTLAALLLTWIGGNSFSTMRWQMITPDACAAIQGTNPAFMSAARVWCSEIQALRIVIWLQALLVGLAFSGLLAYCLLKSKSDSGNVWTTPFSAYKYSARNGRAGVFSHFSFESPGEKQAPTLYPFDMRANSTFAPSLLAPSTNSPSVTETQTQAYTYKTRIKGKGRALTPEPPSVIFEPVDIVGSSTGMTITRTVSTYPY